MDEKKRPRRSSILKRRSRSVSPKRSPPAMSKTRSSRRISFSERNAVREFAINDNKDTIWVASYEEPTERIDLGLLKQPPAPAPASILKRNPLQAINVDNSVQTRIQALEAEFLNSSIATTTMHQPRASVINYTAIESKSMDISVDASQLSFLLPNHTDNLESTALDMTQTGNNIFHELSPIELTTNISAASQLKNTTQHTNIDCEDISIDTQPSIAMPAPKLPKQLQPPKALLAPNRQPPAPQSVNESDMDISNIVTGPVPTSENAIKLNESVHSERSIEFTANIARNSKQAMANKKSPKKNVQRQSLSRMVLEKTVTRNDTMDSFLTHEQQCQGSPEGADIVIGKAEHTIHYNKTINETLFDANEQHKRIGSEPLNPSARMVSMANVIAVPSKKSLAIKMFQNKQAAAQAGENVVSAKQVASDTVFTDQPMDMDESIEPKPSAAATGPTGIPDRCQTVSQTDSIDISDVNEDIGGHVKAETIIQCNKENATVFDTMEISQCQPTVKSPSKRFTILNDLSMNETIANVQGNVIAAPQVNRSVKIHTELITHTSLDSDNMDVSSLQAAIKSEFAAKANRLTVYESESIDETLKRQEETRNSLTNFRSQVELLNESLKESLGITRKPRLSDEVNNISTEKELTAKFAQILPNIRRTILGNDTVDESIIASPANPTRKPSETIAMPRATIYDDSSMEETLSPQKQIDQIGDLVQRPTKSTGAVPIRRQTIHPNENMDESQLSSILPEPINIRQNRLTNVKDESMDMTLSPKPPVAQGLIDLMPKSGAPTVRSTILPNEHMDVSADATEKVSASVKRLTTFQNEPMDQTMHPEYGMPSNISVHPRNTGAIPKTRLTVNQTQNMDESVIGGANGSYRPKLPSNRESVCANQTMEQTMDESIHDHTIHDHTARSMTKARPTIYEPQNMDESDCTILRSRRRADPDATMLKEQSARVRGKEQNTNELFASDMLPSTSSRSVKSKRSTMFNVDSMEQTIHPPQDPSIMQQSPKINETFSALSLVTDASSTHSMELDHKRRRDTIYQQLSMVETDAEEEKDGSHLKKCPRVEHESSTNDVSLFRRKFVDMTTINLDDTEDLAEVNMSLVTSTENVESDTSKATFDSHKMNLSDRQGDNVVANDQGNGPDSKPKANRRRFGSITLKSIKSTRQFIERKNRQTLDESERRKKQKRQIQINVVGAVELPLDDDPQPQTNKPAGAQAMEESFAPKIPLLATVNAFHEDLEDYCTFMDQMKNVAMPEAVAQEGFYSAVNAFKRLELNELEREIGLDEDALSQNVPAPDIKFLMDNLMEMWEEEDNKRLEAELENRPPGALGPYFREFYFMIRNKLLSLKNWIFPPDEYFYFYSGLLYLTHPIIESILLIVKFDPNTVAQNWDLYDSVRFTSAHIRPNDPIPAHHPPFKKLIAREVFQRMPKDLERLFPSTNQLGLLFDFADREILQVHESVKRILNALYTIDYGTGLIDMDGEKPYIQVYIMDRETLTIQQFLILLDNLYTTGSNKVKTIPAQRFKPAIHELAPGVDFIVKLITDPYAYIDIVPDPYY